MEGLSAFDGEHRCALRILTVIKEQGGLALVGDSVMHLNAAFSTTTIDFINAERARRLQSGSQ